MANRKEFFMGMAMMAGFVVVFVIIFMPLFDGRNGLNYLDDLYNSISKGSAYYIPAVTEEVGAAGFQDIQVSLAFSNAEAARQAGIVFNRAQVLVNVSGNTLKVRGDLGVMLKNCLADAEDLYQNNDAAISGRYGLDGRRVLYTWWESLHIIEKELQKQKAFRNAKLTAQVVKKAVEPAYNYSGIEAWNISDKIGIVLFSLVFYVIYTLWYGFSIMYMFEGWGMQLEDH